jgi:hypothetical protein
MATSTEDKLDDLALRLARIEENHKHLTRMLEGISEEGDKWRDTLSEALNGNGHPGIKTRLDRLEQFSDGLTKHFWAIWGSLLAVGVPALIDLFRKHSSSS